MLADDPNIAWDNHFTSECTREPVVSSASDIKKCCACNTKLGLSNIFVCLKCHKNTCLSHRNAVDHPCIKSTATTRGVDSSTTNKRQLTATQQAALDKFKAGTPTQTKPKSVFTGSDNTVHGTAGRRGKGTSDSQSSAGAIPSGLTCPFCGLAHSNEVELVSHVESAHMSVPSSTPAAAATVTSNERCPVCSMSFPSAVDLVTHFETAHSSNAPPSNSKSDCSLA